MGAGLIVLLFLLSCAYLAMAKADVESGEDY
jgi:hypothetical protein